MSLSPTRSSTGGTILGLGTVGLGESFGKATDKEIEEESMRTFWSKWRRTKEEWQRADEGRSRKIVEMLAQDRAKRAADVSRQREVAIARMQAERKQAEEARRVAAEKEAEELRRLNKLITEAIKKGREDGLAHRKEDRLRELEELHREREMLIEVSAMAREAEEQAKREHIEVMRRWNQLCKEKAKADAERRLKEKQEEVASKKQKQHQREEDIKNTREGILKCKSVLVKTVGATHENGKMAVAKTALKRTKEGESMRAMVQKDKVLANQRASEHHEERSKMVRELQERTRAARQQYEDERRATKEALKEAVRRQKEAARELMEEEERERLEEQSVHIANVRALVSRRRTDSRGDSSCPRTGGRRTASLDHEEATPFN